ncbi:MAG: hypothetical protein QM770_20260 [Tepidisphaeraceae bacterium]
MNRTLIRGAALAVLGFAIIAPTSGEPIWSGGTPITAGEPQANAPQGVALQPLAPANGQPFLHPGRRVSYIEASARIAASGTYLTPNANGTGKWTNPATGQTYDESSPGAASGAGVTVLDFCGVVNGKPLFDVYTYLYDPKIQGLRPVARAARLEATGDYWRDPAELAALRDAQTPAQQVMRLKYPIDNVMYDAIRIQFNPGTGWTQRTYDLQSGILLCSTTNVQAAPTQVLGPNNTLQMQSGGSDLAITRLTTIQEVRLPGLAGAKLPDWFKQMRGFAYDVQTVTVVGGQGVPVQGVAEFTINQATDRYVILDAHVNGQPAPQQSCVPGTLGAVWMDPNDLAGFKPGQTLDDQPQATFKWIVAGKDGQTITIAQQFKQNAQTCTYDARTGMLLQLQMDQQLGLGTTRTTMTLRR